MPEWFITGTDTGVGKTSFTCALLQVLSQDFPDLAGLKPVASGAGATHRGLLSEDTQRIAAALDVDPFNTPITGWTFPDPVAPPLAARRVGGTLDLESIVAFVRAQTRPERMLLVEGVGGLLCPLTERETVADLIATLGMPSIVVSRRSLGMLNHTLLTLEVAAKRGLPVVGVVVSETTPPTSLAEATNLEELQRYTNVPILGKLPHGGELQSMVDWVQLAKEGIGSGINPRP